MSEFVVLSHYLIFHQGKYFTVAVIFQVIKSKISYQVSFNLVRLA